MNRDPGEKKRCRVLVVGTGSPLRRDDAAALYLIEELKKRGHKCILSCPMGIELCAHHISRTKPDLLVIVDAAIGIEPGSVKVLKDVPSTGLGTTHNIDPSLLHKYISNYAHEIIYVLLGVKDVGFGEGLTRDALKAVKKAIRVVGAVLREW